MAQPWHVSFDASLLDEILAKRSDLHELAGSIALKVKALIEREDEVSSRASLGSCFRL